MECVSHFNCLASELYRKAVVQTDVNLDKLQTIYETINRIFRSNVSWDTKLKFQIVMADFVLSYTKEQ